MSPSQLPPAAPPATAHTPRHTRRRATPATTLIAGVLALAAGYGTVLHPTPAPGRPVLLLRPRTASQTASRGTTPNGPRLAALPPGALALPFVRERADTLRPRESLAELLVRAGLTRVAAAAAARGAPNGELPAGVAVVTRRLGADSTSAEITARPAVDRVVHLQYLAGAWHASVERLPWRSDTITASARITSTLFDALHASVGDRLPSQSRSALVDRLAEIFEHRVDVAEELERGDSMRVLVERRIDPTGVAHDGQIVAAALTVGGRSVEAVRFRSADAPGGYFDQFGRSLRANFLRAPLEYRRVSSGFGMREHPILGIWKMHTGTDYAAVAGTPVRAVGDGVVAFAGRKGGYGNVLEVRHANGYVSRYGHLRGFARGVRTGARVAMGRTIGYVGMTGLATAPHLHFEMLLGGASRDPGAALRKNAEVTLPRGERAAFDALRVRLLGVAPLRTASTATSSRAPLTTAE